MKAGVLIYASCPRGQERNTESERNLKENEKSS